MEPGENRSKQAGKLEYGISRQDVLKDLNSDENAEEKRKSSVNTALLPIKLHYFSAYGGFGGVLPFLPILIRDLGINATVVGVIYAILPFTVLFTKPLLGALTDYFKNIRYMIIMLVMGSTAFYSFVLLIPPIQPNANGTSFECEENHSVNALPITFNPSCIDQQCTEIINCEADFDMLGQDHTETVADKNMSHPFCCLDLNETNSNKSLKIQKILNISTIPKGTQGLSFGTLNESDAAVICVMRRNTSTFVQYSPGTNGCRLSLNESPYQDVYNTYQFWIVLILVILGGICSTAMFSLSDAACYEILRGRSKEFGKQRLWAVVSWGAVALSTGYLNDLKSSGSMSIDYSSGFFILIIMSVMDIILLLSLKSLKKSATSASIFKDVGRLFSSHQVIIFATGVFIIGAYSGLQWTYEFLFLKNLGANQMLFGLAVFVQCIVAEVPFLFYSGSIIHKLGHSLCLILTFATFALRFLCYFMLTDPWYVLIIDVLHGWTFGIFYATMTSYASHNAPHGTEATMQGLLGGFFEGLGVGVGSLFGGISFDKIGGHNTFLWTAISSLICTFIFSFYTYFLNRRNILVIPVMQKPYKLPKEENDIFTINVCNLPEHSNL